MITDTELEKLSYEIDDILTQIAIKYELNSLTLSAVFFARLKRLNDSAKTAEHFTNLLKQAVIPAKHSEEKLH
jgi:hypothetical protein